MMTRTLCHLRARKRHVLALFVAFALFVTACGTDDNGEDATNSQDDAAEAITDNTVVDNTDDDEEAMADAETDEDGAVTETDEDEAVTDEDGNDEDEPRNITIEPVRDAIVEPGPAVFTAAGGIAAEFPQAVQTFTSTRCLVAVEADYSGDSPFAPGIAIGSVSYLGRNRLTPLTSVEQWFAGYEGQPAPVETGETITVLGYELDGYRIEGAFVDEPTGEDSTLSCAVDAQNNSDLQIFAAVYSDLYIGETDDGFLVVTANGFTAEEQEFGRDLLDAVLPTLVADDTAAEQIEAEGDLAAADGETSFELEALGTSVSFDSPVPLSVVVEGIGAVAVGEPDASTPFGPNIVMFRAVGFATGDELVALGEEIDAAPADTMLNGTFDDWLASASEYVVGDVIEMPVAGRDATIVNLQIPDGAPIQPEQCGPPDQEQCVWIGRTNDQGPLDKILLRSGEPGRNTVMAVVDQGEFAPLVILVSSPSDLAGWNDQIIGTLAPSLRLGEPQPAPE